VLLRVPNMTHRQHEVSTTARLSRARVPKTMGTLSAGTRAVTSSGIGSWTSFGHQTTVMVWFWSDLIRSDITLFTAFLWYLTLIWYFEKKWVISDWHLIKNSKTLFLCALHRRVPIYCCGGKGGVFLRHWSGTPAGARTRPVWGKIPIIWWITPF